ncbi:tetratricopeptide repeat protein [Brasilonema sennae]|uniref:tetratricopeptide repeat protein n=1 Tax=Brasilonema sennae TaxID=1397703 RepID=UPI00210F7778|nr:tetratricopeptide repeat protein [Brasilonema sennae]
MFQGSANFVGRQHELSLLQELLQQPGAVAISAVSGMGGVGKTELATQYARQHQADYPGGICWLNARESNLAAEIVQFAQLYMNLEVPQQDLRGRLLSLNEQVHWCWQHWQPTEGLALVVLDDIIDLGSCREFLPTAHRFRVLMTTRLRNLDSNIEEISLDVLSPEEALQLLTKLVGERRVQKEEETAKLLCEWLGYLPLGLELVGRYLAKKPPHWTLAKMLQRLKQQRLQDEAINRHQKQLQQTLSTAQLGVLAAFELSWLELAATTQRVGELLSLFAPDIFAWEWVESATSRLNWDASEVETAVGQLYERHLIQWVEDKSGDFDDSYKIHPLIREFLKLKRAASEQVDELKQDLRTNNITTVIASEGKQSQPALFRSACVSPMKRAFAETFIAIAKTIPYSPTRRDIESVKDAIPHLAEVAQNLTDAVSDENLPWVFTGLGRFYEGQGLYALAQPWLEQCVSVVQSRLGEEHPDVAASYNNLALLYYFQGRYTNAEPLYIKALELRQRLLGEEHPDVANSYNNLAELYRSQGRYTEAEPLYINALELRLRLLGEEHPDIALSYNNLALLYYSQGRYTDAEPLLIKALELRLRLLGQEHPDVAASYNNLAALYDSQGRYIEAEPLYIKALELLQRLLGDEHPYVAASYNNLAFLYDSQRRYTEAEPLYIKALELRRRLLGDEHPDVALSFNNLAALYKSQGRYTQAEPLLIKALELYQRLLGEEHPDVATSYNNLAALYDSQGRYTEAEPLYIKALELRQRLLGDEHPSVATSYNNLATLYKSLGRYTEAEPLYIKALEIAERSLGVNHPNTITFRKNLQLLRDNRQSYNSEHFDKLSASQ